MCAKALRLLGMLGLATCLASCLAGCSSTAPVPGSERYMVSATTTPFYRYGPAQGVGADSMLQNGTPLTLLYRSYGYSRVMLEDGTSGYVSTDAIVPLPPQPKPARAPASNASSASFSRIKKLPRMVEPPAGPPLGLPELPADPLPSFRY